MPRIRDQSVFPYEVSIGTMFAHADPSLLEWLEYHLLLGVQHFWLYEYHTHYDPASSSRPMLQPYIDLGLVSYEWMEGPVPYNTQLQAFPQILNRARGVSRWLLLMDIDEFVNLAPPATTLPPVLKLFDAYAGVAMHWQMFGTSRHTNIRDGELLIQQLRWKADSLTYVENFGVKTAVQPLRVSHPAHPHSCLPIAPWYIVDTDFHAPDDRSAAPSSFSPVTLSHLWLNHYFLRTEHFFRQYKMVSRRMLGDLAQRHRERMVLMNKQLDTTIQRFVPELRRRLGMHTQSPAELRDMDAQLNRPLAPYTEAELDVIVSPCPALPSDPALPLPPNACVDPDAPRIATFTESQSVTLSCTRDGDRIAVGDTRFGVEQQRDPLTGMMSRSGCGAPIPAVVAQCDGKHNCTVDPAQYPWDPCPQMVKTAQVAFTCKHAEAGK